MSEAADGGRITLRTIGFAGKSAETFFETLRRAGVQRVIDTRLNNVSQLAGYTKKRDLQYFLHALLGIDYVHDVELAPTKGLLDDFKKKRIDWPAYEGRFLELMEARRPDKRLSRDEIDGACLLCSEPTAEHCHRRLVAEFLRSRWGEIDIRHL